MGQTDRGRVTERDRQTYRRKERQKETGTDRDCVKDRDRDTKMENERQREI